MKLSKFQHQFRKILTDRLPTLFSKPFRRRSVLISVLLFTVSLIFSPIVAHSLSSPDTIAARSGLEVAQAPGQNPVEQAKSLYARGSYSMAADAWQEAVDQFADRNDLLNQAIALSNLSLSYKNDGRWDQATQAIKEGLALVRRLERTREVSQVLAEALDIQGGLELAKGDGEAALKAWKEAFDIYQEIGDLNSLNQNQINQAQALQLVGKYVRAENILKEIAERLKDQKDSAQKVITLASLGNIYQAIGDVDQAKKNLYKSGHLAEFLGLREAQAAALISLGNAARSTAIQSKDNVFYQDAKQHYEEAAKISHSKTTQIKAELNQLSLFIETQEWSNFDELQRKKALRKVKKFQIGILRKLQQVPRSQTAIYSKINLVQNLMCAAASESNLHEQEYFSPLLQGCSILREKSSSLKTSLPTILWEDVRTLTEEAVQEARDLRNRKAVAYALGYNAATYQQNKEFEDAENYTRQALGLLSSYEAGEVTYLLQWQLGRLYKARKSDLFDPKTAYSAAFETLQSIRQDLSVINPEVQYSFRDSIEPLYREYADLLLKFDKDEPDREPSQENLSRARTVIEALQLAEINDFFRDACTEAKPQDIDKIVDESPDPTVVIYPIFLEDRIEVILKLRGEKNLDHYRKSYEDIFSSEESIEKIQVEDVEQIIDEDISANLREINPEKRDIQKMRSGAEKIYDLLIRPAEDKGKLPEGATLVFVLDEPLRKIPMAVLHDSQTKEYLIKKYAVALVPGLQLVSPRPFSEVNLVALLAGVSEEQEISGKPKFDPLEQVEKELESIEELIQLGEPSLLNQEFSLSNLEKQASQNDLTIIHISTHGEFNDNLNDSFVVAWKKLISVREIDRIFRENRSDQVVPIELLTLSACETATGNDRAVLGIAGVAIRAGARSTVATLWKVDQTSTAEFMKRLYQGLKDANQRGTLDKANVLRKIQLDFLNPDNDQDIKEEWKDPYYWASFLLIGNWL